MRKIVVSLLAGFLLAPPGVAMAQSSGVPAASAWNDAYGKTDNQRALDLRAAEMQEQARKGGYGPGQSTTNIAGDLNAYTSNNGPQNSSSVVNSVNSNTTTTNASGSGIDVIVSTGQTSGTATQTATAKSYIGTATTTTTCGGNNSCTGQ